MAGLDILVPRPGGGFCRRQANRLDVNFHFESEKLKKDKPIRGTLGRSLDRSG